MSGVVAAGDTQTAAAGAEVLAAGGNAVDAALGAMAASWVCELPLGGPGGGGVLMARTPGRGWAVLDFFAATPGLGLQHPVPRDFYPIHVDFGPTTQAFHVGRAAVAVPSGLQGLVDAHAAAGRLPLRQVVAPAVRLAREGYVLGQRVGHIFEMLEPILRITPEVEALFSTHGRRGRAGDTLVNPGLADLLEAAAAGGQAFLDGPWVDACLDVAGAEVGGLLTRADFTAYATAWRAPLIQRVGSHAVLVPPPPASGGELIALGLRLAVERALSSRDFLGPAWMSELASIHGALSDARADNPMGSTTHISVLTADGDAASVTVSSGEGCGHAAAAWGTHLNNFLGEEDINPEGFHRQAPGTRMTTMMSPTVVLRGERPVLVLGTGGSNRIRSVILQVLLDVLVAGRPLAEAVRAPRLHVEGERLWFEAAGLPTESAWALEREWPEPVRFDAPNLFFGGVHAAVVQGGDVVGIGDARRDGAVARS